ncbi:hypothetical protein OUZ56_027853 [Daphnia magna]|uniref:Uncharacterized protein n=1 Tax=Daphnia magna TaxID=35525 RepID=A0ABR0B245_9CRUS|nr:hypothetical protein OUZ56_027853 [Daphnia magna]
MSINKGRLGVSINCRRRAGRPFWCEKFHSSDEKQSSLSHGASALSSVRTLYGVHVRMKANKMADSVLAAFRSCRFSWFFFFGFLLAFLAAAAAAAAADGLYALWLGRRMGGCIPELLATEPETVCNAPAGLPAGLPVIPPAGPMPVGRCFGTILASIGRVPDGVRSPESGVPEEPPLNLVQRTMSGDWATGMQLRGTHGLA